MAILQLDILKQAVYAKLENNRDFYPESMVVRSINDALKTLNLIAGVFKGSETTISVENMWIYDTPGDLLFAVALMYDGHYIHKSSLQAIGSTYRRFTSDSKRYPQYWFPIGVRKFGLYPAPSKSGDEIVVEGILSAPTLPDDSAELPDDLMSILVDLAWHSLPLVEGGKPFLDAALTYQELHNKTREVLFWKGARLPRYRAEVNVSEQP